MCNINKVKMKHLLFITISGISTQGLAAASMTDSFESGDLSHDADGIEWYASNKTTVSSDIARTGSKSLKFAFPKSDIDKDSWAEQRFDLGNVYPEVWVQYYIYFPDGSEGISPRYVHRDVSGSENNKFIRLWGNEPRRDTSDTIMSGGASMFRSDEYSKLGAEYITTYNGTTVKHMGKHGIPSQPLVTSNTIGTWIKIKYHVKAATSANNDGVLQFWINDKLVVDEQSLDTYPGNGYQNGFTAGYLLGWANTGFAEPTNIYIDDVEFSTKAPAVKAPPRPPTIQP